METPHSSFRKSTISPFLDGTETVKIYIFIYIHVCVWSAGYYSNTIQTDCRCAPPSSDFRVHSVKEVSLIQTNLNSASSNTNSLYFSALWLWWHLEIPGTDNVSSEGTARRQATCMFFFQGFICGLDNLTLSSVVILPVRMDVSWGPEETPWKDKTKLCHFRGCCVNPRKYKISPTPRLRRKYVKIKCGNTQCWIQINLGLNYNGFGLHL